MPVNMDPDRAYAPPLATDELPRPRRVGALAWWYGQPWRRYNGTMFVMGVIAYTVLWRRLFYSSLGSFREPEAFPFGGVGAGAGFMFMINVCYGLGPFLDFFVPHQFSKPYRTWAFRLGFSVSVAYIVVGTPFLFFTAHRP